MAQSKSTKNPRKPGRNVRSDNGCLVHNRPSEVPPFCGPRPADGAGAVSKKASDRPRGAGNVRKPSRDSDQRAQVRGGHSLDRLIKDDTLHVVPDVTAMEHFRNIWE